jgi:hypothetical protein
VFDRVFQIKTTHSEFGSASQWCLTVEYKGISSKLQVRPCRAYSDLNDNLQLFERNEGNQLFLNGPQGYCVASLSRLIEIQNCDIIPSENQKFSVGTDGKLGQSRDNQQFFIGFDSSRMFPRIRLYKLGTSNDTLGKWSIVYGMAALPTAR